MGRSSNTTDNATRPIPVPLILPCTPETTTCHTDAAWNPSSRAAGLGGLIKIPNGLTVTFSHAEDQVFSPLMAEALAIRGILIKASDIGISCLNLFSDALDLIRVINRRECVPEIHGILSDIQSLVLFFESITFNFVSRLNNVVADSIAKRALTNIGQAFLV